MKKLVVLALTHLFLLSLTLKAQNNVWSLPPNYFDVIGQITQPLPGNGLTNPDNPYGTPNYMAGTPAQFSHNAIQDASGNLLFFVIDGVVYDKNGEAYANSVMTNNLGFNPAIDVYTSFVETMIVPAPGDCNRFYIFSAKGNNGFLKQSSILTNQNITPGYSILDIKTEYDPINYPGYIKGLEDNGFGGNVFNLPNSSYSSTVQYAATSLNPLTNERFIFVFNNNLVCYKLSATGISYVSTLSSGIPGGVITRSEMEVVELPNGNYRLGLAFSTPSNPMAGIPSKLRVGVMDINSTTGLLVPGTNQLIDYGIYSNSTTLPSGFSDYISIHGLEFSPDGKYLYIMHTKTTNIPSYLDVFQVGVSSFPQPFNNIPNISDFRFSQIELDKFGKLNFIGDDGNGNTRIATLSNPNTPDFSSSVNSQWNDNVIPLNNYPILERNSNSQTSENNTLSFPLPDQIDGMDYTAYLVDPAIAGIECCRENSPYDVYESTNTSTYEFNGIHTWDATGNNPWSWTSASTNNITVKDKMVITSGSNITINNMVFEFAPKAQLIIENGARLTINGTTLTADTRCTPEAMWHGVEVWGNGANQPFTSGRFTTQNNSVIEHAMVATANFQHKLDGNGDPIQNTFVQGFNGGIIQATDTKFRNNFKDTQFETYFSNFNNDQSRFIECHFVTDAHLNTIGLAPFSHAVLRQVRGLKFVGCVFEITGQGLIDYPAVVYHGFGIRAFETLFSVTDKCSVIVPFPNTCPVGSTIPSEFNNLFYGVVALGGTAPTQTAKITNNLFNDNFRGMYLANLDLAQVTNNAIYVSNNLGNVPAYGLFLNFCNRYKVEDNDFTTTGGYYGAYINSSGVGANEIYRNSFTNFTVASQAANLNGNGSSLNAATGLEFRCNTYTNTADFDILVSSGRVKSFQGLCQTDLSPVNNIFSYTATQGDYWLADAPATSIQSDYRYSSSNNNNLAPRSGFYNLPNNTGITECTNLSPFDYAVSCPKRVGKTVTQLNQLIAGNKQVVNDLQSQIDGGDTQGLVATVSSNQPTWQIHNALMAASPYLSDKVMLTMLKKTPSLPNYVIQQVLLANAPLSDEVFIATVEKTPVLPDYLIRNLAIASSPLHTKEQLAIIHHAPKYPDWMLTQIMENNSPLKEEVLLALMDVTPNISSWSIRTIFIKNTPLSEPVSYAFNNHFPSYPNWVVNSVNNSPFMANVAIDEIQPQSVRMELDQEIAYYEAEVTKYSSDLMRIFLFDERKIDEGIEDVIAFLETENCNDSKCLLTCAYLADNQFTKAQQKIDTLILDTNNLDFCNLYNSVIQYEQTVAKEFTLLTNPILRLPVEDVAIATTQKQEVGAAKSILEVINGQQFQEVFETVVIPSGNNLRIAPASTNNNGVLVEAPTASIFPNPADEQFTLSHNLNLDNGTILIVIYDVMGKEVLSETINKPKQIVTINRLKSGMYFYNITQGNSTIKTDKLVVK